jgi:hypothetical protein
MTITRIQALIIAAGLVLVGVAVARAGHDTPSAGEGVRHMGGASFAQTYPLRDSHLRPETPPEIPGGSKSERPSLRL